MALFTDDEKYFIEFLNFACDTSPSYAARIFEKEIGYSVSAKAIKNNWKKLRLPINSYGGLRNDRHIDEVIDAYHQTNGDFEVMAEYLDLNPSRLLILCERYSINPRNMPSNPSDIRPKINNKLKIGRIYGVSSRGSGKKRTGKRSLGP